MKQFIYLFSGLLLLFASTPRVVAQEIGDYSQLNDEDKSAQLEQEIKYDEIKKNIIEMYAMATSQIRVLQMKSESLILANVQYEISEKNFANGTIESADLSTDKERQSQAREAYEKSKYELTKSLMILEVISRTPIIRK